MLWTYSLNTLKILNCINNSIQMRNKHTCRCSRSDRCSCRCCRRCSAFHSWSIKETWLWNTTLWEFDRETLPEWTSVVTIAAAAAIRPATTNPAMQQQHHGENLKNLSKQIVNKTQSWKNHWPSNGFFHLIVFSNRTKVSLK